MKELKYFCSYVWAKKNGASGFGRTAFSNKLNCITDVEELEETLKKQNGFDEVNILSWQNF